jgi:hypothetical protein
LKKSLKNFYSKKIRLKIFCFYSCKGKANHSSTHGISLFEEIPENCDCVKASIPEHFYSCHEDIKINDLDVIKPIAMKAVEKINSLVFARYALNLNSIQYMPRMREII